MAPAAVFAELVEIFRVSGGVVTLIPPMRLRRKFFQVPRGVISISASDVSAATWMLPPPFLLPAE